MATSDESDIILDFTNVASCTNKNGGKYTHSALYSTKKRVDVVEIYMRLKTSKGRVSCYDLASAAKVGRSFANWTIREVDGTGLAPKTKCAIFGPGRHGCFYSNHS
eukprot:1726350-Ditylum_brightwellii.AAC.1